VNPIPVTASDDDHVWPRHAARRVQLEASSGASAATDLAWYSAEASCCALDWELSHSVPRVLDKDQRTCFKVGVAFRQHDRETLVNGVDAFIGESEDGDAGLVEYAEG